MHQGGELAEALEQERIENWVAGISVAVIVTSRAEHSETHSQPSCEKQDPTKNWICATKILTSTWKT